MDVKDAVLDSRNPSTTADVLRRKKVSERTYRRKQKITELMLLDGAKFDNIVQQMAREFLGQRLNQQILSDRCRAVLGRADMRSKRDDALNRGTLI